VFRHPGLRVSTRERLINEGACCSSGTSAREINDPQNPLYSASRKYRIFVSLFWQSVIIVLCGIKLNVGGIISFTRNQWESWTANMPSVQRGESRVFSEVLSCEHAVVTYQAGTPIRVAEARLEWK